MTIWRPADTITVKALALIRRDEGLLLCEINDDTGRIKGMRPLGGTVEFGEPWRDTLQREFLEELGTRIVLLDSHIVMENLFEHHGAAGHEIIFLCDAYFADSRFYERDVIRVQTSEETVETARWVTLDELAAKGLELYPSGLKDRLPGQAGKTVPGRRFS